MNLDFSKCKTVEDVKKVFNDHEKRIKNLEEFKRKFGIWFQRFKDLNKDRIEVVHE